MSIDTQDLIHRVRFANLGVKQEDIVEMLGITDTYWRKLKAAPGKHNFGDQTFERVRIIALLHRPFPFEVISESNRSSLFARSMESYLKKVTTFPEINQVQSYIKEYLETEKEDWGLLHLYASASFSIFNLLLENSSEKLSIKEVLKTRTLLQDAQKCWTKSADLSQLKVPNNSLLKLLFKANAMSVKIYEDYYFLDNQCAKGNKENYKVFREFADQASSKGYHIPAIWRDCLEQSALLKNEDLIEDNLKHFFETLDEMNISDSEKYGVVLREIEGIDSFEEVEKAPLFQQWKGKLEKLYV